MKSLPDIASFQSRLDELDQAMAEPDFFSDARRAAGLSREHQKLSSLITLYSKFTDAQQQLEDNRQLIAEAGDDEEMRALAEADIADLKEKVENLHTEILRAMIPPEPSDDRNVILEIRAGTGGDEASLFAGDLYRMYSRYAENAGWRIEPLSLHPSDVGGYKEIIVLLSGEQVYKQMKFESGVHRVQRVPVTEAGGRIHTSAATVAVLPEAEEVDIELDPSELEISVARASGPGGQGVNTTDSAVQILHKPTGMIVKCADERSQLKNKAKAMKVLRSRLLEQKEREEREKYAANRKNQVGSGDRSERIRTYNFPQGRITDHRINLTLYNLTEAMEGQISQLLTGLAEAEESSKIEALFAAS